MFSQATFRLTVWYVAILMALSLAFSFWLYNEATSQIAEGFDGPVGVRIVDFYGWQNQDAIHQAIEQQIATGKAHIIGRLTVLNLGVLVFGGLASYALARRTMQPIEAAVDAQNRFTADASHELRTPLAAMKTEIEIALRQEKLSKTDVKELLGSNLEEVDRMSGLAQGLLTLARSETSPHVSAVHAEKIVKAVIKRMQPLADKKHITIHYELKPLKLLGNAKHVDAIIGILLDNAIKYSPPKSVIGLATHREDGHGQIVIRDQGFGIAPGDMPHIFERFYRADSSRSKAHVAGHGLGLSIAQKMASVMQGVILVESTQGEGSTFSLRLPIAQ